MGAWIEISALISFIRISLLSHPTMGAWIEILKCRGASGYLESHPTMGAWIEILEDFRNCVAIAVAPHDGCVD